MKAYSLTPGTVLPAARPAIVPTNQTVREVKAAPDGKISVRTDQGAFLFDLSEEVRFPRRATGQIVNWILAPAPPTVEELAVGDLLPGPGGVPESIDPRKDEDWEEYTEDDVQEALTPLLADAQEVRSVTRAGGGFGLFITLRHRGRSIRRVYLPGEQVSFPDERKPIPISQRTGTEPRTRYRRVPEADVARSGQYRSTRSGSYAFFAINTSGRGRYPAAVEDYDRSGSGLMKPPRTSARRSQSEPFPHRAEWDIWELVDGSPHPADPRPDGGRARE